MIIFFLAISGGTLLICSLAERFQTICCKWPMGQQCLARNASFLFCQLAKQGFYLLIIHEFGERQAQPQAFFFTDARTYNAHLRARVMSFSPPLMCVSTPPQPLIFAPCGSASTKAKHDISQNSAARIYHLNMHSVHHCILAAAAVHRCVWTSRLSGDLK
jgi:hypothetical protein